MKHPFAHSKIDCMLTTGIYEEPLVTKQQGPSLRHCSSNSKCRAGEGETLMFPLWQVRTRGRDTHRVLGICCLAWPGSFRSLLGLVPPKAGPPRHPLSSVLVLLILLAFASRRSDRDASETLRATLKCLAAAQLNKSLSSARQETKLTVKAQRTSFLILTAKLQLP